jgi:hypothetical protein
MSADEVLIAEMRAVAVLLEKFNDAYEGRTWNWSPDSLWPYSLDIDRYQPRCVACHKQFDMAFVMERRRNGE